MIFLVGIQSYETVKTIGSTIRIALNYRVLLSDWLLKFVASIVFLRFSNFINVPYE